MPEVPHFGFTTRNVISILSSRAATLSISSISPSPTAAICSFPKHAHSYSYNSLKWMKFSLIPSRAASRFLGSAPLGILTIMRTSGAQEHLS